MRRRIWPPRIRQRSAIPTHRLLDLFQQQCGRCYYCLREAWHGEIETLDAFAKRLGIAWREAAKYRMATREHLIKREDGGTDQAFNIVMACAWCNNKRENRSVLDHVKFCRQHFGTMAIGEIQKTDAELIADYVAKNGVTKVDARKTAYPFGLHAIKNCDWAKGKKFKARHRYNLARAWASFHGLDAPVWTDVKEGELLRLRAQGLSYRKIASAMGKTKAAIAARVRYLALGRRLTRQEAA